MANPEKPRPQKSAAKARLRYVSGTVPGIQRLAKGKSFAYVYRGREITDVKKLSRIAHLAIPPAWTEVWICPYANGHLQATGMDVKGRKQYRYHEAWRKERTRTTFDRLAQFGQLIPRMRDRLKKNMDLPGLPREKVLSTVVHLMEHSHARVGNPEYEAANGSYGLTTLKDRHVNVKGGSLTLSFKGKSGVRHAIRVENARLARTVKKCKDIPGQQLFQYLDADGRRRSIVSGMVNDHLRELTGGDFTSKDLRTWMGSVQCLKALVDGLQEEPDDDKAILLALDHTAKALGNTRTVCRKFYVHPGVLETRRQKELKEAILAVPSSTRYRGLTVHEHMLLRVIDLGRKRSARLPNGMNT